MYHFAHSEEHEPLKIRLFGRNFTPLCRVKEHNRNLTKFIFQSGGILRQPTAETLEEKIWTEKNEKETFRVEAHFS